MRGAIELLQRPLVVFVFSYGYWFLQSDRIIEFVLVLGYVYEFLQSCKEGGCKTSPPAQLQKLIDIT